MSAMKAWAEDNPQAAEPGDLLAALLAAAARRRATEGES